MRKTTEMATHHQTSLGDRSGHPFTCILIPGVPGSNSILSHHLQLCLLRCLQHAALETAPYAFATGQYHCRPFFCHPLYWRISQPILGPTMQFMRRLRRRREGGGGRYCLAGIGWGEYCSPSAQLLQPHFSRCYPAHSGALTPR